MWKAVRNGDPGGYAYLAWMHHNGHIGGHLAPHLQPRLPDGGGRDDKHAANKRPGWEPGPRSEEELRETALAAFGEDRLERTNGGRGVGGGGGPGSPGKRGGGGGGRRRRGDGSEFDNDDFDDDGDGEYYDGEVDEYGDYVGDYDDDDDREGEGGGEGRGHEGGGGGDGGFMGTGGGGGDGRPLRTGEDVWGGMPSEESWPWETIGGGVSGAIAAADLYLEGFRVSRRPGGFAMARGGGSGGTARTVYSFVLRRRFGLAAEAKP